MNKYYEIIDLPYKGSYNHKHMSIHDRAAQFMPFSALTGYDDEIKEKGRQVNSKIILCEEEKLKINNTLNKIDKNIKANPLINIKYFIPDLNKKGGSYEYKTIKVKKINNTLKQIILINDEIIKFDNIISILIL